MFLVASSIKAIDKYQSIHTEISKNSIGSIGYFLLLDSSTLESVKYQICGYRVYTFCTLLLDTLNNLKKSKNLILLENMRILSTPRGCAASKILTASRREKHCPHKTAQNGFHISARVLKNFNKDNKK